MFSIIWFEQLKKYLAANPVKGVVIPSAKGLRKIRWGSGNCGKRGGVRIIYYLRTGEGHILFLTIYAKSEVEDLTRKEYERLSKIVEAMNNE